MKKNLFIIFISIVSFFLNSSTLNAKNSYFKEAVKLAITPMISTLSLMENAETESEVVAGYSTEYNGPMLLMIFLCEYFHLVISVLHFILFFLGGWFSFNIFSVLPPLFISYHDSLLYSTIFFL